MRPLLLVDSETLDPMNLRPGIIRENITTQGLNLNGLTPGEQLHMGSVLLRVSAEYTPCDQLEKVRPGPRREWYGRMLCSVQEGELLGTGDAIRRVAAEE